MAALAGTVSVATVAAAQPFPTFGRLLRAGLPIYCGAGSKGYVAFTFDDGPGPYSRELVALLKQYHVRATFFLIGEKAVREPQLVRLEASAGAIGDHSFTHPSLSTLPRRRITRELAHTKSALERLTGRRVILFRPPFGDNDPRLLRIARRLGMLEVLWNEDSGDASEPSTPPASAIRQHLEQRVHAGGIVLLHEDEQVPATLEALKQYLPSFKQTGLKAVSVPELLTLDPPAVEQLAKGAGGCHSSWHRSS